MDERERRKYQPPTMTEPEPPATNSRAEPRGHERLATNDAPGDLRSADVAGTGHEASSGANVLFTPSMLDDLRERWTKVQTGFVDEPRRSVQDADHLVADTVKHLAESFAAERTSLEGQWSRGDQVSTEDLRQILRRYRTFFDRLLSV
jgi:hypothetical protein